MWKAVTVLVVAATSVAMTAGCSAVTDQGNNQSSRADSSPHPRATDSTHPSRSPSPTASAIPGDSGRLPAIPKDFAGAVDYPGIGKFAGENPRRDSEVRETLRLLPSVRANDSEEAKQKLARQIFRLFHETYSMPSDPLKQWKAMTLSGPGKGMKRFKKHYQVAILLDSSGSMVSREQGKTRLQLAKSSIRHFVTQLPGQARVALWVYGHKGSNATADRPESCRGIEKIYPLAGYDASRFQAALRRFQPGGWTPLARSIDRARQDLKPYSGKEYANVVYIVSDGIETCGGDPVASVKRLADSNIEPMVSIVGYDVDNRAVRQLKRMARVAHGSYISVHNQDQLDEEFGHTAESARLWLKWANNAEAAIMELRNENQREITTWRNVMIQRISRERNNLMNAVLWLQNHGKVDAKVYETTSLMFVSYYKNVAADVAHIYHQVGGANARQSLKKSSEVVETYLNHTS